MLSTPEAGVQVEKHITACDDGSRGFWLRTASIEAYVQTQPAFRLRSVHVPGGVSLLADESVCEQGLRLAFMEPEQIPASFDVGNQPATVIARDARTATLRLGAAAGLGYTVSLSLDDLHPRLHLDCELENLGAVPRTVACWTVMSFARGNGTIVAPFAEAASARRRLVLPSWATWPQPGVHFGRDTVAADTASALNGNVYKLGLITDAGWIAFARDGQALVDSAPFNDGALYPEDGANVTFFEAHEGDRVWCEIERLGPLETITPSEKARLSQTLTLITASLPKATQADSLRRVIETRLRTC